MEIKKNIVVVGCGYWGKNLVRNYSELGALAGICDPTNVQAYSLAQTFNCQLFSWDAVLSSPEIKAVVIAAPAALHAQLAREALLADKDVFVEKPLALELQSAQALTQLAVERKKILMVGHLLQYHPAFLRLKEIVQQGGLGEIQYVYSNRLNLGKVRREEDILWSFAPHDISMILSLIGQEPSKVSAVGGSFLAHANADVTTTHLSFVTGVQAHIFVSWLHPFKEQKLIVVGSKAMAAFDDTKVWSEKLTIYKHKISICDGMPVLDKAQAENEPLLEAEPLKLECQYFIECIDKRLQPRTDGAEGVRVLRVLQKASESLKKNAVSVQTQQKEEDIFVHQTACIDENVTIGAGTKIWHFSHVCQNAQIGENNTIGQNVMIGPGVVIGNRCKIQNNVSLYKGVTLEDGVFCGPSCVFTNVNTPRAEIERKSEFQQTYIERGATIGANVTIVCGNRLGAYCLIGAGAVVTKPVKPHALMVGNPAKQIGWVSHAGERLNEDLICPRENRRYVVEGGALLPMQEVEQVIG